MEKLYKYIKESILDDQEDLEKNLDKTVKLNMINDWIIENSGNLRGNLKVNNNGFIDVRSLSLTKNIWSTKSKDFKFPLPSYIRFGKVRTLEILEGIPCKELPQINSIHKLVITNNVKDFDKSPIKNINNLFVNIRSDNNNLIKLLPCNNLIIGGSIWGDFTSFDISSIKNTICNNLILSHNVCKDIYDDESFEEFEIRKDEETTNLLNNVFKNNKFKKLWIEFNDDKIREITKEKGVYRLKKVKRTIDYDDENKTYSL